MAPLMAIRAVDGYCYSAGLGTRGQLGHSGRDNCNVPRRVDKVEKIVDVVCGDTHSVFLDGMYNVE